MRSNQILQMIYSFFLGLVVVGFVGVGVHTFYPPPRLNPSEDPTYYERMRPVQDAWMLNTSIILLVCATIILVVSLIRAERQLVIANGLLLGGLLTMIYAVGRSLGGDAPSIPRFLVIAAALVITVAVGWLKFVRRQPAAATASASAPESEPVGELAERLAALEARLDAVARALRD